MAVLASDAGHRRRTPRCAWRRARSTPRGARSLEREARELIVPAPVSAEVDYLLRRRAGPGAARLFLQDVVEGRFRVEGLTREEHGLVLALDERYSELDLGLADVSDVILARRFRTQRLLTFDERDFRAVKPLDGDCFELLPRDR